MQELIEIYRAEATNHDTGANLALVSLSSATGGRMPTKHGLVRHEGNTWLRVELLGSLGLVAARTPKAHLERCKWLEFHMRKSIDLLGRALCSFGSCLRRYELAIAGCESRDPHSLEANQIQLDLELLARVVFDYLNVLRDNAARIAVLAHSPDSEDRHLNGFGTSKAALRFWGSELYSTIEQSERSSWYELAFKPAKGLRQRLVHFNDVVSVHATRGEGQSEYVAQVYITGWRGDAVSGNAVDFGPLVCGMFDWLDELDTAVRMVVAKRSICNPAALARPRSVLCGLYEPDSAPLPWCSPGPDAFPT